MNCELAHERIVLAAYGELPDEQGHELDRHLAACTDCSQEREQLLEKIFRNQVSPLVFNTLGVMNQHGRLGLLDQMAGAYGDLLDEQLGKVEVDVTVAQSLSPEQLETARQRISQALKRDAIVHQYVNADIIGGMIVRVGDKLIDASVKYQLSAMRDQLLAATPK